MKYGELTLGQIEAIMNRLGGVDSAKRFLAGEGKIVFKKYKINLDAAPFVPKGLKVKFHQKGGQFAWSPKGLKLYLSPKQKSESFITGNDLRKELKRERVMNASLLDYLLKYQELIPESWKDMKVFFWGTVYCDSKGDLYVRFLCFRVGQWVSNCESLDCSLYESSPAVVAA